MTAKAILNPYSGRWKALKYRDEAEAALQAAGVVYDLAVTTSPGHGTELARQAVLEGFSPIIAAGGDGSISEVVNGMAIAHNGAGGDLQVITTPLGILPLGSANDLVNNLGLPERLPQAAEIIAFGNTRRMDLCQVNGRFFDNNSAIGLEPYITMIQERIHRLRSVLRYLVATLRGVAANPQWVMDLEWKGGSYSGPVTLVTVGNCPRTGGLFYVTPHANPFDGLLTIVYGSITSRAKILRVLPMIMKPERGNYVEHPAIHEIHSPWLRVHSTTPTPMHADGEIQAEAIWNLEYKVFPSWLPVLLP
jgi:diacylglycerol kinase (ATP)